MAVQPIPPRRLARLESAPLTYAAVGASASASSPPGYRTVRDERVLERAQARFEASLGDTARDFGGLVMERAVADARLVIAAPVADGEAAGHVEGPVERECPFGACDERADRGVGKDRRVQ